MKILLLHASAGAGHKRAAQALEKGFHAACPEAEVNVCDILDFTAPLFRKTYAEGYLDVVRKAPELWGYLYAQSDRQASDPVHRKMLSLINKTNTITFSKFFREFAPDIAVCTHFMPLEIISTRLHHGKTEASLFCTVTDFAVHSLWILEDVGCYYVATEEARRQLLRRGQPDDRIAVSGIPIDPVFSKSLPKETARRQLGLDLDQPVVLILSGGCGHRCHRDLGPHYSGKTRVAHRAGNEILSQPDIEIWGEGARWWPHRAGRTRSRRQRTKPRTRNAANGWTRWITIRPLPTSWP